MPLATKRLAMFSMISWRFSVESRGEQHPLCRTLENREHRQPTHFPSAYTCMGDDAGATCTSLTMHTTDAGGAKEEEPGGVTWWVYGGRRNPASDPPEDLSDDAWVDCTEYYARSSLLTVPATYIGAGPIHRHLSMNDTSTSTEWISGRPTSIEAKGTTPSIRSSQANYSRSAARIGHDRSNSLVYAPNTTCDDVWLSWPAVQERAIADGTVLVFDVFNSVGNLFLTFDTMIKFVRLLELGLVLKRTHFPGFGEAFNPGEIYWDVDDEPFIKEMVNIEEGVEATGLHVMQFYDFAMVLSDSQVERLALTLGLYEKTTEALTTYFKKEIPYRFHRFMSQVMREPLNKNTALRTQPCTWNMLLSRSPSMMAHLEQHSPWGGMNDASGPRHQTAEYIAWHIRTSDGETAQSYTPIAHKYVIQETSSYVCPTYLAAMEDALQLTEICHSSLPSHAADELVYISSNSKTMAEDCTVEGAHHGIVMGHVDIGLNASDAHTAHTENPLQSAIGAFLDFLFLLDATVIVRTGSSFSGTVCHIKGLTCQRRVYDTLPKRTVSLCLPTDC